MTLSDLSIQRPVLTWMMTLALVVFGFLGYSRLGVDLYPPMDFPVVGVVAVLPGASPEGIEEDVTDVLEEQLSRLEGLRTLSSTSRPGVAVVIAEFALGTNLDVAQQDVRDMVSDAMFDLPDGMETPNVGRYDPNEFPVMWVPMHLERSPIEATEYVKRQLSPIFETIPGVAGVALFGEKDRNIRIWLDGDELRSRGLTSSDVLAAVRREHVELPAGKVESNRVEYSVKTDAEFRSIEALRDLVLSHDGTAPVLLRDVARVEDGSEDIETIAHHRGEKTIGLGIRRQAGVNTVGLVDVVVERIDEIRELLPTGMEFAERDQFIDWSASVREAVAETQFALLFGAALAVITVFVFLRRSRPTFIVAAAIPISLITTFGLVWLAGYTLNTMTLLGMTLAVGVVIDDAIVVLENIARHREGGGSPREAASVGTREITFAATAATFSVAAVFLPMVFVEGVVGSFLREFGFTVAVAVIVSLFVALTLTPMLAARMPPPAPGRPGGVRESLGRGFEAMERRYRGILEWTLAHRGSTVLGALLAMAVAVGAGMQLKGELFPPADESIFQAQLETAPGTALDVTDAYVIDDVGYLLKQPEVRGLFSMSGGGGSSSDIRSNRGMFFGTLSSPSEREADVFEFAERVKRDRGEIPGRKLRISTSSGPGGGGNEFEFVIKGHRPLEELSRIADEFIGEMEQAGGYTDFQKSLELGLPELRVIPDRAKAAALGVSADEVARTIEAMIGGVDVGSFKEGGSRFDIRVKLEAEDRADPEAIGRLYVRSRDGGVVELRNLVSIETGAAPSAITRTDRQRSVEIGARLVNEKTTGEATEEVEAIGKRVLPRGMTVGFSGMAKDFLEGLRQFGFAMGLAILVIYMVLAAQFESFVQPLVVMLALPFAMVGALGGLWVFGHTLNMFSLIGIILLFGLVTKNSILLVDYANQLRDQGLDKLEAMRRAAPVRMRPVLMTALSMIFGVLPAAIGLGPGSETRAPMAIATATGMFSSTLLTLLVVPVFYVLFDDLADGARGAWKRTFGTKSAPVSG